MMHVTTTILNGVRMWTAAPFDDIRHAVIQACDNVLKNPMLPGSWWAEQIELEAIRLLGGPKRSELEAIRLLGETK